jgi:hypothetical protein
MIQVVFLAFHAAAARKKPDDKRQQSHRDNRGDSKCERIIEVSL